MYGLYIGVKFSGNRMKEGMVNRGEGIPQRHNTIEVLMMCVDEQ